MSQRRNRIIGYIVPIFIVLGLCARSFCTDGSTAGNQSGSAPIPSCEAAYAVEINTGTVILEKNAREKMFPASTTKLMTALLAAEFIESGQGNPNDEITFSREAVFGIDRSSTHIAIDVGEKLTVRQVLYAILLPSANEACLGMAEYVSGSIDGFIEKMNQRAQQLGMKGTHFVTANGLHDDEHYTTAEELSILMKEALKHNILREIMSVSSYKIPPTNKNNQERILINTNKLILESNEYYDSNVVCGKTGYTTPAGNVLVAYSEVEGMGVITVLMKADKGRVFKETSAIVKYCAENLELVKIENILDYAKSVPALTGGAQIMVSPAESFYILTHKGDDYEEYKVSYVLPEEIVEKTEKGEKLGTLTIFNGKTAVGTVDMVSLSSHGFETAPGTTAKSSDHTSTTGEEQTQTNKVKDVFGVVLKIFLIVLVLVFILTLVYVGIIIISVYMHNKRRKNDKPETKGQDSDKETGKPNETESKKQEIIR